MKFYKSWDLHGALSNFSPHPIAMPGPDGRSQRWASVEHYYQAHKFIGSPHSEAPALVQVRIALHMADVYLHRSPKIKCKRELKPQHPKTSSEWVSHVHGCVSCGKQMGGIGKVFFRLDTDMLVGANAQDIQQAASPEEAASFGRGAQRGRPQLVRFSSKTYFGFQRD